MAILRDRNLDRKIKVVASYYHTPASTTASRSGRILGAPTDSMVIQGRIAIDQAVRILEGKEYMKHVGPALYVVDQENIRLLRRAPLAPATSSRSSAWSRCGSRRLLGDGNANSQWRGAGRAPSAADVCRASPSTIPASSRSTASISSSRRRGARAVRRERRRQVDADLAARRRQPADRRARSCCNGGEVASALGARGAHASASARCSRSSPWCRS